MPGGIEGELTDANVIFFGVGIHNVRMGMGCSGMGGGVSALIHKVRNVQFHGKVTCFKLEGLIQFLFNVFRQNTFYLIH